MSTQLTIYLADDHEIVATGLASILNSLEIVRTVRLFPNGQELFKAVLSEKPDLIFLDIEMPRWDGIRTLQEVTKNFSIPCVMLSMLEERSIIEDCVTKGAMGYLHKDSKAEELAEAIKNVISGKKFFSEEATKILTGQRKTTQKNSIELSEPLTTREEEILKLICDGLTSKEIGEELYVSHRTVETHKKNLMQKFDVNTTGKLISVALKNKFVK